MPKKKLNRQELQFRPKHHKLASLVEKHLRYIETGPEYNDSCRYFRNATVTIAVLEKAGLLKPGTGLLC